MIRTRSEHALVPRHPLTRLDGGGHGSLNPSGLLAPRPRKVGHRDFRRARRCGAPAARRVERHLAHDRVGERGLDGANGERAVAGRDDERPGPLENERVGRMGS
jgi:hypothetical protein